MEAVMVDALALGFAAPKLTQVALRQDLIVISCIAPRTCSPSSRQHAELMSHGAEDRELVTRAVGVNGAAIQYASQAIGTLKKSEG
eukprot:5083832-Amphidinium_carterae.1